MHVMIIFFLIHVCRSGVVTIARAHNGSTATTTNMATAAAAPATLGVPCVSMVGTGSPDPLGLAGPCSPALAEEGPAPIDVRCDALPSADESAGARLLSAQSVSSAEASVPAAATMVQHSSRPSRWNMPRGPWHAGLLNPHSSMKWIPGRSHLVGVSCFFYLLPALWGLCPLFLIQVLCSLMSDYIMTGKDSRWHPADRCVASFNVLYITAIAFAHISWWEVVILDVMCLSFYSASVTSLRSKDYARYVIMHSLWHLTGGMAGAYLTAHACDFSFGSLCRPRATTGLYCGCGPALVASHPW